MARFRYVGHPDRPKLVTNYGPLLAVNVPTKDGVITELRPKPPAIYFNIGEDLGYEITDAKSLRALRADTKFEEIL
jgi:hypothetical protein